MAGFAMIAPGPGLLVVAPGGATVAAVAHIWRWRVVVVGIVGLVSSWTDAWVIAIGLPLAIVGIRHASGTVQVGWSIALQSLLF